MTIHTVIQQLLFVKFLALYNYIQGNTGNRRELRLLNVQYDLYKFCGIFEVITFSTLKFV